MKRSTVKLRKLRKSQRNYTRQNENSLDSLACVTNLDYDSALVCISFMIVKALHHNY